MTATLRTDNVVKTFRGGVDAVNGLSFEIEEGSIFALIGPNGAGKTTTVKVLMNILKPTSGRAEILGVDSRRLGPEEFGRIGYVSENQEMPEWMTLDYLLGYLKPFYPDWDDARAAELISQFNLPRDRKLKHLSRGMKMKAALVSSLAYHPRVLVLDEPFSGLDPMVREDLIEGLVDSASETTMLISSHDLGDIESFASHIGYLEAGRLEFAEEMPSLTGRFREVEVIMESGRESGRSIPGTSDWPDHWMGPESADSVVRFVDTRFDPDRTPGDVRRVFGDPAHIRFNAMPLRSIFVTMARNAAVRNRPVAAVSAAESAGVSGR